MYAIIKILTNKILLGFCLIISIAFICGCPTSVIPQKVDVEFPVNYNKYPFKVAVLTKWLKDYNYRPPDTGGDFNYERFADNIIFQDMFYTVDFVDDYYSKKNDYDLIINIMPMQVDTQSYGDFAKLTMKLLVVFEDNKGKEILKKNWKY